MPSSRLSIAELRAVAQPPSVIGRRNAEHWAGRLYMRRISPYVTYALLRTPLSANAVTFLMAVIGVAGAFSFVFGGVQGAVVGAVLIQVYLLLDCSDGEMARVRGTTGATGIFLDRLGHFVVEASIMVAAGLSAGLHVVDFCHGGTVCPAVFVTERDMNWLIFGLIAALVHSLGKLQTDLVEVARAKAGLPPVDDDAETSAPRGSGLRSARRLASMLPLNRALQAVEASILVLVATIAKRSMYDARPMRVLVVVFLVAAIYEFAGHLVGILASSRLRS